MQVLRDFRKNNVKNRKTIEKLIIIYLVILPLLNIVGLQKMSGKNRGGAKRGRKAKQEPTDGVTEGQQVKQEPTDGVGKGRKVKEEPTEEKPARSRSKKGNDNSLATSAIMKKGKKTSVKNEPLDEYGDVLDLKQRKLTDMLPVRKKRDRFHGMTEDEVLCRTLPDHLAQDLDILIIGINPGLTAAYVGHHYAGPGNHFWKCLHMSGLTPEQMNAYDDFKLKEFGIGFTNIVERTSRGSADLTKKEIKEGAEILAEKIRKYKPKIAAFNGKGIYEIFCGHKKFFIGKQPEPIPGTDTAVYVMPSSSARFTQLPRAIDKVPFYVALRKLRDHLCGLLPHLDESEVTFPDLELKVEPKKERLDAEVKVEVGTTTEGGKTTPKQRKRKAGKAGEADEHNSPEKQPNVKVKVEVDTTTEGGKTAPKRRKRKGKAGEVEEQNLLDKQPSLGMIDQPSSLAKVKTEPGVSTSDVPFPWNGLLSGLPGISGAYSGNPNTYLGKPSSHLGIPSAHSGSSSNACSGIPYQVPFTNSFAVKEELAQDLSQYGVMPLSSSSNNPYSSLASSFQVTVPSVYNGFPPVTLPFVTGSTTSSWPNGALPPVYSNPLVSLAASFSYAPHSSALTRIQPLRSGLRDRVPGLLKNSSPQEEEGTQRF